MRHSNNKVLQAIKDRLVRWEVLANVNPELCSRTHPKLLVGKCPWCGLPIERGMKPSDAFEKSCVE